MKRREFIISSIAGMLFTHRFVNAKDGVFDMIRPELRNWVWMELPHDLDLKKMERTFKTMRRAGIHSVLPQVFPGYLAYYRSAHLPNGPHLLDQILPLVKDAGLEAQAWIWCMMCNIKDIRENHKDWFVVNRNGDSCLQKPAYVGYYNFLCPNHAEVQQYVRRTVEELAEYEDLDGIHLDYIRFPDVILAKNLQTKYGIVQDREYPEYDYCYCDTCRSMFGDLHGRDPLELKDPEHDIQWLQFRYDSITNLVNQVLVPAARHKGKKVTAAVFPNGAHVRQEWSRWEVDGVMPMLYHAYYGEGLDWIGDKTREGITSLREDVPLYSGLDMRNLDAQHFREAVSLCREAGASGVALFNLNYIDEEHWHVLSASMTKAP